jgi:subtilisin family serine protease
LLLSTALGACASDGEDVGVAQHAIQADYIVTCSSALSSSFANTVANNGDSPAASEEYANPPQSGDDDFFLDLQWGHDAVNAIEAWNNGVRGQGVRVAVLDTGFDMGHPDLAPNINYALSKDFTGEGLQYTLPDPFSHGTHTAGTIAAADNGFGTVGIAPDAELVLIKVLGDAGSGSFGDVLAGMYYAADNGAQVVSMSLGALFPRRVDNGPNRLSTAMDHASNYIRQNGGMLIAASGNDSLDFDHSGDWIHMPSDAANAISVSATAPRGWATQAGSTYDYLAGYSNYGRSAIDFAGPGGDWSYAFVDPNELCTVGNIIPITRPCFVFDYVFSTGNGGWYWSVGTSMATPHVAGVAALVMSDMSPNATVAQVETEMRRRSIDIASPGSDPISGKGHVSSGY